MLQRSMKPQMTFALLLSILLMSCATTSEPTALQKYDPLIRAGFDFKEAETESQFKIIESVPPQQIVPYTLNEKLYYVYVISECPCAYVGDEKNYNKLKENLPENQPDKNKLIGFSSNQYIFSTSIDRDAVRFLEEPLH